MKNASGTHGPEASTFSIGRLIDQCGACTMPAAPPVVSDQRDGWLVLLQNVDGVKEIRKKPIR